MTSTIAIEGSPIKVLTPPLEIRLQSNGIVDAVNLTQQHETAKDYWKGIAAGIPDPFSSYMWTIEHAMNNLLIAHPSYLTNNVLYSEEQILDTGRCIADEAYLWGFSSLLLLTFCASTMMFAITMIGLQTDVYWNSRHDRQHQSHSIYADVITIVKALKAVLGEDVMQLLKSPKELEESVEGRKHGVRHQIDELPPSRAAQRVADQKKMRKAMEVHWRERSRGGYELRVGPRGWPSSRSAEWTQNREGASATAVLID